ncbi:phytanoyl-CoA dioxygenase family protein [Phormidium tenue FACHB-886]|nr:phytanoyl-CoA dioxygenase family protein [Phormidium tenue FACHB-886]
MQLTDSHLAQFRSQGFLILDKFLPLDLVEQIDSRLDPLFATRFETGVYPDEWHGRPGLSQPNATRQMVGMWRCDRTVASLSLSAEIARLNATLAGWTGGRLAMDSCWIKPPNAPAVSYHRNNTLVSCLQPATMVTCWIAFSDITAEMGTLEVVPGSHRWQCADRFRFLHAPVEDYRQPLWQAAAAAGVAEPEILKIELPIGGCVFLDGNLWHGSGCNITQHTRRSFAVSTLPAEARFQPIGVGTGYIFSRYRRLGEDAVDESFLPILWTPEEYRSPMVLEYCRDALAV